MDQDIDMTVEESTGDIPKVILEKMTSVDHWMPLSLAHNGTFGFTATLQVLVGNQVQEKIANLFYYNEESGVMEHIESRDIDEEGYAEFTFEHASDYIIILSDEVLSTWDDAIVAEILDETMPQEETVASNVQSTEESNTWKLVVIILVFLVIAGGAALFVFQKKGKKSN